jgi:hypothetical protein
MYNTGLQRNGAIYRGCDSKGDRRPLSATLEQPTENSKRPQKRLMEKRESQVEHLQAAELQFRLATAVRLAVTMGHQPLDLPVQWSHGKHSISYSEIAISKDESIFAAWTLQHSATFLMASAVLNAVIRNAFSHSPFDPVWHIDKDCREKNFELPNVIQLDCKNLDGKPFDWRHYGGPLALLGLSRFVCCNLLGDIELQEANITKPEQVYYQQGDLIMMQLDQIPESAVLVEVEIPPGGRIPHPGGHFIVLKDDE